jgi:hypothetical protein
MEDVDSTTGHDARLDAGLETDNNNATGSLTSRTTDQQNNKG